MKGQKKIAKCNQRRCKACKHKEVLELSCDKASNSHGITLVALVVSIVVMLVLARCFN